MARSRTKQLNEQLIGEIVYDQMTSLVGKLISIRKTPIFKDELAKIQLADGSVADAIQHTLRKASDEQRENYFKRAGFHKLSETSKQDSLSE